MSTYARTIVRIILTLVAAGLIFMAGVGYGSRQQTAGIPEIVNVANKTASEVFDGSTVTPLFDTQTDFAPFWKSWAVIDEKFFPGNHATTTDQERVWGAIEGMVASLGDPHSVFLPPQESETFQENISGNFGGIGIEIGVKDDILTVISPLKGTPAARAGFLAGDKILKIGDTTTSGLRVDEAVRLIRGEVGTEVILTILHEKEEDPREIKVMRAVIEIPTIKTEMRSDGVFVIELYSFSANSPNLFRGALREFVLSKSDKLILDLRGNTGGYLQAAVEIASYFLPQGFVVVTEDFAGDNDDTIYRSRGFNIFTDKLKMIILVDGGTASASEILAGALSEYGKTKLVGTKTFGKGSVQEMVKITDETSLKLTVAHWRTPKGDMISEKGLEPDYTVEYTKADRDAGRDPQKDKAVDVLLQWKK